VFILGRGENSGGVLDRDGDCRGSFEECEMKEVHFGR
jgi:hypothetical protein